jgi:hypothetical protein
VWRLGTKARKAKYYPGVITRVRLGGKAFDIDYDDGEQEMGVKRELILLPRVPRRSQWPWLKNLKIKERSK